MFEVDAARVRALAVERQLTTRDFAKAAGLHCKTAAKILHGGATVNLKTLGKLAKFFGVDGSELLKRSD